MLTAIFLDRDGIINDVILRQGIVSSPRSLDEFKIRAEFTDLYRQLMPLKARLFVVSNQPDVSRRLLDDETLSQMTERLRAAFDFDEIVYCRHDDSHACSCRKPKPGMILDLLERHRLQADESIIIGDSYKDILAGKAAGIRTIYYCQGYNSGVSCEPDYSVSKLSEVLTLPPFTNLS